MHPCLKAASIIALLILSVPTARADSLSELARNAHRSSVQSIQQLSCKVVFHYHGGYDENAAPHDYTRTGRYWRVGEKARAIRDEVDGETRDVLVEKNILKSLEANKGKRTAYGGIAPSSKMDLTECDAYANVLLHLRLPNGTCSVPLDQLLDQATRVGKAQQRVIDGREHIILHFDSEDAGSAKWKGALYLDASVNYLVRRATYETNSPQGKFVRDYRIVDFQEVAPAIYFPTAAVYNVSVSGNVKVTVTTTLKDLVVNRPLPADALDFRFVEGMEIGDSIRGAYYRVDAKGNRISPERPYAQKLAVNPSANPVPRAPVFPSTEEPTSWTSWLPYFFGTIFIAAVSLWVHARLRAAQALA